MSRCNSLAIVVITALIGSPRRARAYVQAVVPSRITPPRVENGLFMTSAGSTVDDDDLMNTGVGSTHTGMLSRRDVGTLAAHLVSCAVGATVISTCQDVDCAYLKPQSSTLRPARFGTATGGMSSTNLQSYTMILNEHRLHRVPLYRHSSWARAEISGATATLYSALFTLLHLKQALISGTYDWNVLSDQLSSPVLTHELEKACVIVRKAATEAWNGFPEGSSLEIGFDWGSCGWRHCGAAADLQETLAELRNFVGLYEPFECLFCFDIAERSIRDMLAVIPTTYHSDSQRIDMITHHPYISYKSSTQKRVNGDEPSSKIDQDFLNALNRLRNDFSSNEQ